MRVSNCSRWLAVAAALALSGDLAAQSTASLVGRVVDAGGAAISGVQVVVTNQNSGSQNGALTQSDGRFVVSNLRAGGPYRVEARMIGYGLQAMDGVARFTADRPRWSWTLAAASPTPSQLDQ
jgi:hypothetical protein